MMSEKIAYSGILYFEFNESRYDQQSHQRIDYFGREHHLDERTLSHRKVLNIFYLFIKVFVLLMHLCQLYDV